MLVENRRTRRKYAPMLTSFPVGVSYKKKSRKLCLKSSKPKMKYIDNVTSFVKIV